MNDNNLHNVPYPAHDDEQLPVRAAEDNEALIADLVGQITALINSTNLRRFGLVLYVDDSRNCHVTAGEVTTPREVEEFIEELNAEEA